ncbi:HupE/UreJ family protein [Streptomyces sp. NPDC001275]
MICPHCEKSLLRKERPGNVCGKSLIHGLGFAGALDIREPGSWGLLLSLLTFNLGIEAVQLVLIAALFPLLTLARRTSAARWIAVTLTTAIVTISLYWFLDRIWGAAGPMGSA